MENNYICMRQTTNIKDKQINKNHDRDAYVNIE